MLACKTPLEDNDCFLEQHDMLDLKLATRWVFVGSSFFRVILITYNSICSGEITPVLPLMFFLSLLRRCLTGMCLGSSHTEPSVSVAMEA